MSRRIVQLTVSGSDRVYALDQNGIGWRLLEHWNSRGDIISATWERLPALPSIENPTVGRRIIGGRADGATGDSLEPTSAPIGANGDSDRASDSDR